jgi:hypothetical protein
MGSKGREDMIRFTHHGIPGVISRLGGYVRWNNKIVFWSERCIDHIDVNVAKAFVDNVPLTILPCRPDAKPRTYNFPGL